ncbi:MAG TPA: hypothetical protein VGC32_08945 [Solirubrobacterales bacterium]
MPRGVLVVLLALTTLIAGIFGAGPARAHAVTRSAADRLWNRGFAATTIEADRATPFSHPGQIKVYFYAEGWYPNAVGWYSPCGHSSLQAHIDGNRIWTGRPQADGRDEHCPRGPRRRSRWLEEFFRRDPHWRLVGGRLLLRASNAAIRLRPANLVIPG